MALPVWVEAAGSATGRQKPAPAAVTAGSAYRDPVNWRLAHDRPRPRSCSIFVAVGRRLPARRTCCSGKLVPPGTGRARRRATVYECGEPAVGTVVDAVRPAVLRRRPAVRDLRRGTGVLLPVGGRVRQRQPAGGRASRSRCEDEAAANLQAAPGPAPPADRSRTPAAAKQLAWLAFADILVFFGVLLVGFAYLWKRGDLEWVRSTARRASDEPGATADCNSTGREVAIHGDARRAVWKTGSSSRTLEQAINWARAVEHVADDVRPGLLRHRDDGDRRSRATTSTASAPAPSGPRRGRPT